MSRRKTSPYSDMNAKRKLQFGQAVLLGCVFERRPYSMFRATMVAAASMASPTETQPSLPWGCGWYSKMPSWWTPPTVQSPAPTRGWHGPYKTRGEAVNKTLLKLGVH